MIANFTAYILKGTALTKYTRLKIRRQRVRLNNTVILRYCFWGSSRSNGQPHPCLTHF